MTEKQINTLLDFTNRICVGNIADIYTWLSLAGDVMALKSKPENAPSYQLNLLDIVQTDEPQTSQFLGHIFRYKQNGQYILLSSFMDRFLSKVGLSGNAIRNPCIITEFEHIDVCILDDSYAIIIENKIKNANFQRNQLGRYIESIHKGKKNRKGYPYDKIFLVLLPQYLDDQYLKDIRKSVWRCPEDWKESNATRACSINDQYQCWCDVSDFIFTNQQKEHCRECKKDFFSVFHDRISVIHSEFSDWLSESADIIPAKEVLLKSALYQFSDFTRGLYQTRINNNLFMDIQKHINEMLFADSASNCEKWIVLNERLEDLSQIKTTMEAMRLALSKNLIDEWFHQLKEEWPALQRVVNKSFGLQIQGVFVGCWCGSDNGGSPYWGFQCNNRGNEEQRQMVVNILAECDLTIRRQASNFIAWCSTLHGADRCRAFYKAAQRLGYIN